MSLVSQETQVNKVLPVQEEPPEQSVLSAHVAHQGFQGPLETLGLKVQLGPQECPHRVPWVHLVLGDPRVPLDLPVTSALLEMLDLKELWGHKVPLDHLEIRDHQE